jgi:hypothetical protein
MKQESIISVHQSKKQIELFYSYSLTKTYQSSINLLNRFLFS